MGSETAILVEGLAFAEGPRWREGKLWFSDMHARRVMTVDLAGNTEALLEVPPQPSGLGWSPDGRLLVVSMVDRRLLRLEATGLEELADLGELASYHCNDMVVDQNGRAYVGNFGFDLSEEGAFAPAEIILVEPEGKARVVADELAFPNGTVITPDGRTLIVAETYGARLTAFDVGDDGSLANRRVWAAIDGTAPDGICLDADGAVWVASPLSDEVLRVHEGSEVTDRVHPSRHPYACMLGGDDRRTLFICTAETHDPVQARAKLSGRIETVEVTVAGAGLP